MLLSLIDNTSDDAIYRDSFPKIKIGIKKRETKKGSDRKINLFNIQISWSRWKQISKNKYRFDIFKEKNRKIEEKKKEEKSF